jgi:hypothetical protein
MTWFQFFALYISPLLVFLAADIVYRTTEPRRKTPAE